MYLDEDVERFSTLHSWYKYDPSEIVKVYPLLRIGQQARQPISPDTNPLYDDQLRWWFCLDLTIKQCQKTFKTNAKKIYDASQRCSVEIAISNLGSDESKCIDTLKQSANKFYEETRDIYE